MAIDRSILVEVGYGAGGKPTCNVIPRAGKLGFGQHRLPDPGHGRCQGPAGKGRLDRHRWRRYPRRMAQKLKLLYQTTVNPIRQDFGR